MGKIHSVYGIAALFPFLFGSAADSNAQTQKAALAAPAFEVISIKSSSVAAQEQRVANNTLRFRQMEFKGNRLTGDTVLFEIIQFASPDLMVDTRKAPDRRLAEAYQIEAIAPAGTTLDGVRAMLRTALAERLGLQYHGADREEPVFYLVRGNGPLKLLPATEPDPKGGPIQSAWLFRFKSAPMSSFARFLSSVAGRDVIDKTGIQGKYQFNVDWREYLQEEGSAAGPARAISGVKSLGLKLEPGKAMKKYLVVDRVNKIPTPN